MSYISSDLVREVYKSRNNLLEIMKTRGFDVENFENFGITDIDAMLKHEQLDMTLTELPKEGEGEGEKRKKVYVRYNIFSNITAKTLPNIIDDLYVIDETLGPDDELLIISKKDSTSTDALTKVMTKKWIQDKIYVHVISLQRLQFNILNHTLVPKHSILADKEQTEMLQKFNVTDAATQLPVISRFDPVANVLGIRPGQVCKIERSSRTAVTADYYRVCE